MKIVQINSVCGVGSTGKIAVELYKKYELEGHECTIAYGRGTAPDNINTIKIGNKLDFYLHAALSRITDRQGFYSKKATKKFIKQLEVINPDMIHLHNIHGYYLNLPLLFDYIKIKKISVIWTLHDCWAFTGHCSHFDFVDCDKWKVECYKCPQKKEYPKSIGFDNSKKNYREKKKMFQNIPQLKIITPSKWLANLVNISYLKYAEIEVVENTIDKGIFRPRCSDFRDKYNLHDKTIILGVASPWSKRKGFYDFLQLSKQIDDSLIIVMVGLNDYQISILPKNIIGIKRTTNSIELAEIYSTADIFFNPTYEDNYPTVNLEAESCGTRVITYNTGGCSETLKRSDSYVVKKGDIHQVLEIIG